MKIKNVMLVAIMILGHGMFAQQLKNNEKASHPTHRHDLKQALALTDDQDLKVKSINDKYRSKFIALKTDSNVSRESVKTERKNLMIQKDAELKNVLNETHYNNLANFRSKQKQKAKQHGNNLKAERLKTDLALTVDQYTKVKEIDILYNDQFKKIKSDSTVSKENTRVAFHKLNSEKSEAINKVLSPDQRTKLAALKAARHKAKPKYQK